MKKSVWIDLVLLAILVIGSLLLCSDLIQWH